MGDVMKRLVLVQTPGVTRIDPQFCDHRLASDIMPPCDPGGPVYVCPTCQSMLDEDYNVVMPWQDEIEF